MFGQDTLGGKISRKAVHPCWYHCMIHSNHHATNKTNYILPTQP